MKKLMSVSTFLISLFYEIVCFAVPHLMPPSFMIPHLIQIDVSQLTIDPHTDIKPYTKDWSIGLGCQDKHSGAMTNRNGYVGLELDDMLDASSNHFVRNLCSPGEEDRIVVISRDDGHTVVPNIPESCQVDLNKIEASKASPYSITTAKLSGVVTIRNNEPTIDNLSCELTYEE